MSSFCTYTPNLYSRHNGLHGNHEISKTQITFIFEDNIFLHLSGPIGQIYAHNKMSDVFNLGLIIPVAYSTHAFFHHFKISLIFMNMQMR